MLCLVVSLTIVSEHGSELKSDSATIVKEATTAQEVLGYLAASQELLKSLEGIEVAQSETVRGVITVQEALELLEEGEKSHQYYIDNPEECSEEIGSVKFHQMWLDRYRQIKELLKNLRGDGQD